MEIEWKSLSISLIISIIIIGSIGSLFLLDYSNKMLDFWNLVFNEYINQSYDNIYGGKTAFTIAGGLSFPMWLWITIFTCSFIILTIIFYFSINYLKNKRLNK